MSVPQRIGRYEIAAPLTAGGMAEILLGRLVGPSGFERPVVIKRILPHLSRSPGFVAMFLDEARIVAKIRHPNVVTVLELGQDGDELFLALEYLEGETVGSVAHRVSSEGSRVPPVLAAYVVAEACAGLHAAHEFVGEDGAPQEIVHRDVSPQNLFVTYDGRVVVLDFGIATAKGRLTRTETGALKGKLEYMAPEQCLGEPLDRRVDVFALGIVLYELTTGTRLFRRHGQLATMEAITREPVVPPSRLVDDYPSCLEPICMRALEREREDRYATAAHMRRDLLAAIRELETPSDPEPSDALGKLIRELFEERATEKRLLLQQLRDGQRITHVPATDIDEAFAAPSSHKEAVARAEPRQAPSRVRRVAVVVAAVTALGATLALTARQHPPAAAERAVSPSPSSRVAASAASVASSVASVASASVALDAGLEAAPRSAPPKKRAPPPASPPSPRPPPSSSAPPFRRFE